MGVILPFSQKGDDGRGRKFRFQTCRKRKAKPGGQERGARSVRDKVGVVGMSDCVIMLSGWMEA